MERPVGDPYHFAWNRREIAGEYATGRAVEREPVAFDYLLSVDAEGPGLEIHVNVLGTDDRAFAHPPRDDSGVARHTAARCEDSSSRHDSVKILPSHLRADEKYLLTGNRSLLLPIRGIHVAPRRRP